MDRIIDNAGEAVVRAADDTFASDHVVAGHIATEIVSTDDVATGNVATANVPTANVAKNNDIVVPVLSAVEHSEAGPPAIEDHAPQPIAAPTVTATERALGLPELVRHIIIFVPHDRQTLAQLSRVGHSWARAALPHLWRSGKTNAQVLRIADADRAHWIARHIRSLNVTDADSVVEPALPDQPSSLPRLTRVLSLYILAETIVRPSAILDALNACGTRLAKVSLVPYFHGPVPIGEHLRMADGIEKYYPRIWMRLAWHCPSLTHAEFRDDHPAWAFPAREEWVKFHRSLEQWESMAGPHGYSSSSSNDAIVGGAPGTTTSASATVPRDKVAVAFPCLTNFVGAVREKDLDALLALFRFVDRATATNILTKGASLSAEHQPAALTSLSIRIWDVPAGGRTTVFGQLVECQPSFPLLTKIQVSFPPASDVEVADPRDIIALNTFPHLESLSIVAATPMVRTATTTSMFTNRLGVTIAVGNNTVSGTAGWRAGGVDGFASEARVRLRNFGDAELARLLDGLPGLLIFVMQVQWDVDRRNGLRIIADACPQLWTLEVFSEMDPFSLFQDGQEHIVMNHPEQMFAGPAVPVLAADGTVVQSTDTDGPPMAEFEIPTPHPPPPPRFPRLLSLSCSSFISGPDQFAFQQGQGLAEWNAAAGFAEEAYRLIKYHAPHLDTLQLLPVTLTDRLIIQIHRLDRGDPVMEAVGV